MFHEEPTEFSFNIFLISYMGINGKFETTFDSTLLLTKNPSKYIQYIGLTVVDNEKYF